MYLLYNNSNNTWNNMTYVDTAMRMTSNNPNDIWNDISVSQSLQLVDPNNIWNDFLLVQTMAGTGLLCRNVWLNDFITPKNSWKFAKILKR